MSEKARKKASFKKKKNRNNGLVTRITSFMTTPQSIDFYNTESCNF
jgi:hypothetical protein